jgi:hypothetical protein
LNFGFAYFLLSSCNKVSDMKKMTEEMTAMQKLAEEHKKEHAEAIALNSARSVGSDDTMTSRLKGRFLLIEHRRF